MPRGQRQVAPDLITEGYEPPCGYWDLNSGLLEEQQCSQPLSHLSSPYIVNYKGKYVWIPGESFNSNF